MTEPAATEASEAAVAAPEVAPEVTPKVTPEVTETVVPEAAPEPTQEELRKETPKQRGARAKARIIAAANERLKGAEKTVAASDRAAEQARVPEGTPEGGEFTKEAGSTDEPSPEAPAAAVEAPTEVPAEGAVEAPATPPEGATAPEQAVTPPAGGYVRVPLGADHPLRDRAREYFDVPADQERDLRAVLQDHTRRRDVQSANQHLSDARAQLAESRADTKYWRGRASTGGVLTPEQQQKYTDLQTTYGQEDADAYRQGIISQTSTEDRDKVIADAAHTHRIEEARVEATRFSTNALNDALRGNPATSVPPQYPHWTEAEVRQALSGYGSICDARGTTPTPSGWYAYANAVYASTPTVMAQLAVQQTRDKEMVAEQAKAKATADAKAKEAAAMKEAATRHSTRPGHVPSTASAGVRDLGTPDEETALKNLSPSKQKKARKARIMERFARGRT